MFGGQRGRLHSWITATNLIRAAARAAARTPAPSTPTRPTRPRQRPCDDAGSAASAVRAAASQEPSLSTTKQNSLSSGSAITT